MSEKNNHIAAPPPTYVQAENFGGIDGEYAGFKKSKIAILKVPYEKTTTYKKGTSTGPRAIIEASKNMELYDEELHQETYKLGIHTMDIVGIEDLPPEEMIGRVYSATLDLLKCGKFPVILGGEHSISVGAVKAFKEVYPNISVLQLDAHYDLRDEYNGSRFNNSCTARRISEICPLVQAGTRSLSKEEKDFIDLPAGAKIKTVNVYDILAMPMWKDTVTNSLSENVYITIDLDVFDPCLVPGVGTPEPGGMGWYEMLDLLKEVSKDRRVVGFDIMELSPVPGQIASDFLASKFLYRMLGYVFSGKK